jgi:hypothetical protein
MKPTPMSRKSKEEYVQISRRRYQARARLGRGKLLDEFCEVTGYERKYAIKVLGREAPPPRPRGCGAGRPAVCGAAELKVIKAIWQAAEQPCGKLLVEALPQWVPHYERRHGALAQAVRRRIQSVSAATLDRLLAEHKVQARRRRQSGTRPGTLLKTQIPIRTEHWEVDRPGYLEADTVAHGGGSMAGDFLWSVTLTDLHTGWTELRGVWNKGEHAVVGAVAAMEKALPFALRGFDCDNGSEFLNWHLVRHLSEGRPAPVAFTRSRPYRKNDNAHVEQKNWTHARQLVGYARLEREEQVAVLNALYEPWCLLHNFFRPCFKLVEKVRIGARYRRRYDVPQTPAARLLAWRSLPKAHRHWLREQQATLDPFALQERIERQLKKLFGRGSTAAAQTPPAPVVEGSVPADGLRPSLASLGTASTAPSTTASSSRTRKTNQKTKSRRCHQL